MPKYALRINGKPAAVDFWDPNQPLLYLLRNSLGLHGVGGGDEVWYNPNPGGGRFCVTGLDMTVPAGCSR